MRECFIKVLAEFEKYINEHSYQKFIISEYEVVYLIENSCIEFIYYQKWDIFERVILEEIFNEGIYDLKLKKFQVLSCGIMLQFHPYYGGLGKDLSAIESSFPSRYSRVKQCLPELKIRERFEKLLGFKIPCIVFELSDFSNVGYAVYRTSAKHTINKVIDIGSALYGTCICAKEQNFKHTDYGDYSDIYIRKLRIAIEYQGKQHFEPVEIFGGSNAFKRQQERNDLKRKLSVANNVHLVYINYWEDITLESIEKKIKESLSSG